MESSGDQVSRKRPRSASAAKEMARPALTAGKGIYVPPPRAAAVDDDGTAGGLGYQRQSWDALRRSITGLVNKATAANIRHVLPELLAENIIRGRGLLCRALIKSQFACPAFTDVFAAIAAVVNSKIPGVGQLLLARLVFRLRRAYASNDKPQLVAAARFVAHLVNQGVAHELLALDLVAMLLAKPSDETVEVAVGFVTECGATLREACPRALDAVFDGLRNILHDGDIDTRIQFLIEGLLAVRKAHFRGHASVRSELDLVEHEDQFTHQDEAAYQDLKISMLGLGDDEDDDASSDDAQASEDNESDDGEDMEVIKDETETNLMSLRRTIYLTIMSSVDSEEAGHKLLSVVRPGQEMELCGMVIECCRQERTYTRYYGQLGQRLCGIHRVYQAGFEACFARHLSTVHRMETNELRGTARFFAHLLATDAVPWRGVLDSVRVTEEETTSSSRIFIKMLFQELSELLGIRVLSRRMNDDDPVVREALFPSDSSKNTRFAINFFTAIGLGVVTELARKLV